MTREQMIAVLTVTGWVAVTSRDMANHVTKRYVYINESDGDIGAHATVLIARFNTPVSWESVSNRHLELLYAKAMEL